MITLEQVPFKHKNIMSEFTMSILLPLAGVGFSALGAALGAYGISLFVDKFCSVKVDEAIIRRIEQLNQGTPNKIPTILSEMTVEERARVLERVLDFRVSLLNILLTFLASNAFLLS